jgi:hypothetical protein
VVRRRYYLSNGASVCEKCHMEAETTTVTVEAIRAACGIRVPSLPPGFRVDAIHDKWGNEIRADGSRIPRPLFADDGCRKALARGGKLGLFYDAAS